jgi:hypothetical protein
LSSAGYTKFLIEAKIKTGEAGLYGIYGEVVYLEGFTWQELDDMDWTIVIPPLSE